MGGKPSGRIVRSGSKSLVIGFEIPYNESREARGKDGPENWKDTREGGKTTMKKRTRLAALLLTLCMVFLTTAAAASAYTPQYTEHAQALCDLGLFKGVGTGADGAPDLALDREVTREEALVMLIRLMGEEKTALSYTGRHPFTDVPADHWAYPYVSYAYFKGYTNGLTGNTFGLGQPANANMYLTFVLRALGYSDRNGDFIYASADSTAAIIGLTEVGAYDTASAFYRDDCAYISYRALLLPMSNHVQTLGEYLNAKGVINTAEIKPIEKPAQKPAETPDGTQGLPNIPPAP